jgi:UDP-N-acetyl-2-amino-2-deoxyglucuronate dehydrogenase
MSDAFGYGIIGCGWVASAHAWGVRSLVDDNVRLIGVADRDTARASDVAKRFDASMTTADYRALIGNNAIHAVSVCLPDHLHHEVVIAAAEAGKHILCEKPLSLTLDEADDMLLACDRNNVQLGLVMNHRYAVGNILARKAVASGALGRPLIASVLHSSGLRGDPSGASPWRGRRRLSTGGVLSTQAIHFLDILLWLGGPVTAVKAWTDRLATPDQDHEDTVGLALRMGSGALATLTATSASPIMDDFTGTRVELHGTGGWLLLEGDELRIAELTGGSELTPPQLPAIPSGAEEIVFGSGHVYEVMDFVRTVRDGGTAPIPGSDGRHLIAVVEAAYRSASDGQAVEVEEPTSAYSAVAPPNSLLGSAVAGRDPMVGR